MAFRALFATAALAAALIAPAGAHAAYRTFRSPTGKLGCAFYSDTGTPRQVRCDWRGSHDRAVVIAETGEGDFLKASDTGMDPKGKGLALGDNTTVRQLRC